MKYRKYMFALALLPALAWAQEPVPPTPGSSRSAARDLEGTNATTLAVLHANQPKHLTEAQWLALMAKPENRALFPLRITHGMLDTLDGRLMDLRFRYVLVNDLHRR